MGVYTTAIGGGTNSIILSTKLRTLSNATLNGISIAISSNTASGGNQVYGVLMNSTGSIIATSNSIFINPSMYGTFQTFSFSTGQIISANTDYFIGMAQTQNTTTPYFPYGAQPSAFNPLQYFTSPITGGTLNPLTANFGYFGIEALFGGTCTGTGISNSDALDVTWEIYPNPAKDILYVKYLSGPCKFEIIDIAGKMVLSDEIGEDYNFISIRNLSKGFYLIHITDNQGIKRILKFLKD